MIISTLFIIDNVEFTDNQLINFRLLFAEWVVVNRKANKMLISALIDDAYFDQAKVALTGFNVQVIGKWDKSGNQLSSVDYITDYINNLPPVLTLVDNEVIEAVRAVAVDVVGWAGWAERSFN